MKEKEACPFERLTPQEIDALKRLAKGKVREELGEKAHTLLRQLGSAKCQLATYLDFGLSEHYMESADLMVKLTSELHDVLAALAQKGGAELPVSLGQQ